MAMMTMISDSWFSYAVLELVDILKDIPQIIHVNDWQVHHSFY